MMRPSVFPALFLLLCALAPFPAALAASTGVPGVDEAQLDPGWLRRQIGVVLQENLLFNRTIHENIALGDPAMPRVVVMQAARLAGADGVGRRRRALRAASSFHQLRTFLDHRESPLSRSRSAFRGYCLANRISREPPSHHQKHAQWIQPGGICMYGGSDPQAKEYHSCGRVMAAGRSQSH